MSAGKYNFVVEQGAQHVLTFTYSNDANVGISLDNMSVRMAVKDHITDDEYVYTATSSNKVDPTFHEHFEILEQEGPTTGQFKLTIPTNITTLFDFNQGVYDLEAINGEEVTRLLEGKFKIKPQVST